MLKYFKNKRIRKNSREVLRHACHLRNMREDILREEQLAQLKEAEQDLHTATVSGSADEMHAAADRLSTVLDRIAPVSKGGGLRENFEILVVAVSVAMALRAYFIQPFKIPTGSMQPTLYGIHSVQQEHPGLTDKYPLKVFKFALTGEWYTEVRSKASGVLGEFESHPTDPSARLCRIGGITHKLPKDAIDFYSANRYELPFRIGDRVEKGDLLWSGIITRGDHVFVNKFVWNFRKPRRGEIMVFTTTGIRELERTFAKGPDGKPISTHYIKRMCGLPGEALTIKPPRLIIDRQRVEEPEQIARIERCDPGYFGYQLAGQLNSELLEWPLRDDEYFAMGDNTGNSRDSRYWGPVPARNLVGPAAIVYWPISKRWGLAD